MSDKHEMTAREFLTAYKRMCASYPETDCSGCPLHTEYKDCMDAPCEWDIDKILPAVEQWAKEYPERQRTMSDLDIAIYNITVQISDIQIEVDDLKKSVNKLLNKHKTYAEDFFEKFPNARRTDDESGIPYVCRSHVYGPSNSLYCFQGGVSRAACKLCWNEEMGGG